MKGLDIWVSIIQLGFEFAILVDQFWQFLLEFSDDLWNAIVIIDFLFKFLR